MQEHTRRQVLSSQTDTVKQAMKQANAAALRDIRKQRIGFVLFFLLIFSLWRVLRPRAEVRSLAYETAPQTLMDITGGDAAVDEPVTGTVHAQSNDTLPRLAEARTAAAPMLTPNIAQGSRLQRLRMHAGTQNADHSAQRPEVNVGGERLAS